MELDRKTQLARIDALERQAAEFVALKGQVAEIARGRRRGGAEYEGVGSPMSKEKK